MKQLRSLFLLPAWVLQIILFASPMAILLGYSVLTRGTYGGVEFPLTVENWGRLADPLYLSILIRSFRIALMSTLLCLLAGFPLALFIARARPRRRRIYLYLVILPFWSSFLVRTYAWMFLLRDTGLINSLLLRIGVIAEPAPLLYNEASVVLGLVYGYLPFMVLPLFATLERMDPTLVEAAADLGARPWQTLLKVTLPLSLPGIRAGCLLVFIPCLGAYLTPDLLGGGKTILIGNLIQNQFTTARDWAFGAAVSLALMALVTGLLFALMRREDQPL